MEIKTLNYTAAQFAEAISQTLDSQVMPEQIFLFLCDFASASDTTLVEGQSNGYYKRYFKSV